MSNVTKKETIPPMERQVGIIEQAQFIARSKFIPTHYQGDVGACILAINSSLASGIPIAQIMNGSYIVHGKPSYYGKFVIALVNRKFNSTLQFKYEKDQNNKVISCKAWLKTKDGSMLEGATVTKEMVVKEKWQSSKWENMPELMYMYRAGSFFANVYAPEVLMGGMIEGEVEDTYKTNTLNSSDFSINENQDLSTPKIINESDSQINLNNLENPEVQEMLNLPSNNNGE